MIADDDMGACDACPKTMPIDDMEHMGDGIRYCPACAAAAKRAFRECNHEWKPDMDEWGEPAHYCSRCGFMVSDEDFPAAVGHPAPMRA